MHSPVFGEYNNAEHPPYRRGSGTYSPYGTQMFFTCVA